MKKLAIFFCQLELCLIPCWIALFALCFLSPVVAVPTGSTLILAVLHCLLNLIADNAKQEGKSYPLGLLISCLVLSLAIWILAGWGPGLMCLVLSLSQTAVMLALRENPSPSLTSQIILLLIFVLLLMLSEPKLQQTLIPLILSLIFSSLILRVQVHLTDTGKQDSLSMNTSGRELLVSASGFFQLLLIFLIQPLHSLAGSLTSLILSGVSWCFGLFVQLFAFLFSWLIVLIQKMVQWFISHRQPIASTPSSGNETAELTEQAGQLSPMVNTVAAILAIMAVLLILFFLIRFLFRKAKSHRKPNQNDGFQSESTLNPREAARSLKSRLYDWLHPESLSEVRKEYRGAVRQRIAKGIAHQPDQTPNEYLEQCLPQETTEAFSQLTADYNKERYRP